MDQKDTGELQEPQPSARSDKPQSFEYSLADQVATEYHEGKTSEQYGQLRARLEQGEQLSWEEARWMASVESSVLLHGNPMLGDPSQIGMNFWRITRAYNAVEGKQQSGDDILLVGGMHTYPEVMGLLLKPPSTENIAKILPTLSSKSLAERKAQVQREIAAGQQPTITPPEYFSGHITAVDPTPRLDAIELAAREAYQFPPDLQLTTVPTTIEQYLSANPTAQFDVISWQRYPPLEFFSPRITDLAQEEVAAGKLDGSLPHFQEVAQNVTTKLDPMLSHLQPGGRLQLIGGYGHDDVGRETRILPLKLADRMVSSQQTERFRSSLTVLTPATQADRAHTTPANRQTFSGQGNHSAMLRIQRMSSN